MSTHDYPPTPQVYKKGDPVMYKGVQYYIKYVSGSGGNLSYELQDKEGNHPTDEKGLQILLIKNSEVEKVNSRNEADSIEANKARLAQLEELSKKHEKEKDEKIKVEQDKLNMLAQSPVWDEATKQFVNPDTTTVIPPNPATIPTTPDTSTPVPGTPASPGTPPPASTTPGTGPVLKTPEEIAAEEKARKEKEKQDKIDQKKKDIERILEDAKQTQERKIEQARDEYVDKYTEHAKDKDWVERKLGKLKSFLGFKKDSETEDAWKVKENREQYNKIKNEKGDGTFKDFIQKRIDKREVGKERNVSEDVQKRYRTMFFKNEQAFSNIDLKFIKDENKVIRELKQKVWDDIEAQKKTDKKSRQESILDSDSSSWYEKKKVQAERMATKSFEYLQNNKKIRAVVGNKWFRTTVISSGIGFATGKLMSPVFWVNRIARVSGGLLGGLATKYTLDKILKVEERLESLKNNLEKNLDKKYLSGKVSAGDFDKKTERIEQDIIKLQRVRDLLVGAGAYGMATGFGAIENALHTGTSSGDYLDQNSKQSTVEKIRNTTTTTDGNTQIEFDETKQTQSAMDSTDQELNDDASRNEKNSTTVETPKINDNWYIREGKGIEHPLIKQIEGSPEIRKILGYKSGMDLHDFATREAHKIYLANYDQTAGEVRINTTGIDKAYVGLEVHNGEIELHDNFSDNKTDYEYNYKPQTHPEHTKIHDIKKSIEQDFVKVEKPIIEMEPTKIDSTTVIEENPYIKSNIITKLPPPTVQPDTVTQLPPPTVTPKVDIEALRNNSSLPQMQGDPGTPEIGTVANPAPTDGLDKGVAMQTGPSVKNGGSRTFNGPPTRGHSGLDVVGSIIQAIFGER